MTSKDDAGTLFVKQICCLIIAVFFFIGACICFKNLYLEWAALNNDQTIVASVTKVEHFTRKLDHTKITYIFYTLQGHEKTGSHDIIDLIKSKDIKEGDQVNLYVGSNGIAYYIDSENELYWDVLLYGAMFAMSALMAWAYTVHRRNYLALKST